MNLSGFLKAKEVAEESNHKRFSLGAVIMKRSKVISMGANGPKTHPVAKETFTQTLHAEMQAIIKAKEIPKGSDMYVYRARKCGIPGMAKPCSICLEIMRKVGISGVYYTDPDANNGYRYLKVVKN